MTVVVVVLNGLRLRLLQQFMLLQLVQFMLLLLVQLVQLLDRSAKRVSIVIAVDRVVANRS